MFLEKLRAKEVITVESAAGSSSHCSSQIRELFIIILVIYII